MGKEGSWKNASDIDEEVCTGCMVLNLSIALLLLYIMFGIWMQSEVKSFWNGKTLSEKVGK